MHNEYELLDSGEGRKLERFGDVILSRPCGQASWKRQQPNIWSRAIASFDRDLGWQTDSGVELPTSWIVAINDIAMRLTTTPAGHLGVFPETRALWGWISDTLARYPAETTAVLNLFAYSGGATLAAARAGSSVCHVDSSKSMVTRAKDNAALNHLEAAPIRWIVEDALKFLDREIHRGRVYDAIVLDPPSFGHGTRGEQYSITKDLASTLQRCKALLSDKPAFVLLTSHTQGLSTGHLESLMSDVMDAGDILSGDMELTGSHGVRPVPDGLWVRWTSP